MNDLTSHQWDVVCALFLGGMLAVTGAFAAAFRWQIHWRAFRNSVKRFTVEFELPNGEPHGYVVQALDAEDVIVRLKSLLGEQWPADGQLRNLVIREGVPF